MTDHPRRFEYDGDEWLVIDGGRSLTGSGHLAPAPLRLVQFARSGQPDKPLLECMAPPRPISDLHDAELVDLIRIARQVPEYAPPDESSRSGRRIRTGGPGGRKDQRR